MTDFYVNQRFYMSAEQDESKLALGKKIETPMGMLEIRCLVRYEDKGIADLILVNGMPVDFDYGIMSDAEIELYPPGIGHPHFKEKRLQIATIGRFVAATTRKSAFNVRVLPRGRYSRSCSTRKKRVCKSGGISEISSRNNVP